MPVPDATDATGALLLLQVPPVAAMLRAVVLVAHTIAIPVIAAGAVFTVNNLDVAQPVGSV